MPTTSNVAQKLYLPSEAQPKFKCDLCDLMFYADEERAYGEHMKKCSDSNMDEVMARSTRHQLKEVFDVGDHEMDAWVRKNRKAIIEGRMHM